MKATEIETLRSTRKELASSVMTWMKQISELNHADLQDGISLGLSASDEWMKRRVERRSKVARLKIDLTDAQEKLADVDAKLRVHDADAAEKAVREAIKQLQTAETPAAWVQLRDNLFTLRHFGRIGQSSDMIRKKIEPSVTAGSAASCSCSQ